VFVTGIFVDRTNICDKGGRLEVFKAMLIFSKTSSVSLLPPLSQIFNGSTKIPVTNTLAYFGMLLVIKIRKFLGIAPDRR